MITSLHNSIHLTEMVTILLSQCVCTSGRIINIKQMDTHNIFTLQYALVKGHIHISNSSYSNKLHDFTHATLSPYGKHHACPHIQLHIMYRMTPTVFSWGTQQQQQQFLMTTYVPLDQSVLLSFHSRPPDCSLSAWQMYTPHGCTERD